MDPEFERKRSHGRRTARLVKSGGPHPNLGKFVRATHEFAVYIATNTGSLINYGERFRAGERISSCSAESTVNAVIIKRFAKRQRMQCTKRGICVIDAAGRIMREVKVASEPEATLRMESL